MVQATAEKKIITRQVDKLTESIAKKADELFRLDLDPATEKNVNKIVADADNKAQRIKEFSAKPSENKSKIDFLTLELKNMDKRLDEIKQELEQKSQGPSSGGEPVVSSGKGNEPIVNKPEAKGAKEIKDALPKPAGDGGEASRVDMAREKVALATALTDELVHATSQGASKEPLNDVRKGLHDALMQLNIETLGKLKGSASSDLKQVSSGHPRAQYARVLRKIIQSIAKEYGSLEGDEEKLKEVFPNAPDVSSEITAVLSHVRKQNSKHSGFSYWDYNCFIELEKALNALFEKQAKVGVDPASQQPILEFTA